VIKNRDAIKWQLLAGKLLKSSLLNTILQSAYQWTNIPTHNYLTKIGWKTIFRLCLNLLYFRYFQILTSGFFAGVCTTAIMAPGERIKCILQVSSIMKFSAMYYTESYIASLFAGNLVSLSIILTRRGGLVFHILWLFLH